MQQNPADDTTEASLHHYDRADLIGPQIDIQVWDTPTGDALAIETMGERSLSGNPWIAAANLLDTMSPDSLEIDVRITGGGD